MELSFSGIGKEVGNMADPSLSGKVVAGNAEQNSRPSELRGQRKYL